MLADYVYRNFPEGTILLGDCTEILPLIEPGTPNLILTDIPFNVNLNYVDYEDKISQPEYVSNLEKWFTAMARFKCRKIIKVPTKYSYVVLPVFAKILGYKWTIVQHSPNATSHGPFGLTLFTQYVISEGEGKKVPKCDFFRNTRNELATKGMEEGHPAEMPVAPIKILIEWFTDEGDLIMDPFMGSGTTCVAAKMMDNRKFIGIDISVKYCKMAYHRLSQGVKLSDEPVAQGLNLIK